MKKIFIIFFVIYVAKVYPQTEYASYNGYSIPTRLETRMLNIFINIIFDQTPEKDPLYNDINHPWQPGKANTVNTNVPDFLSSFMDPVIKNGDPKGMFTRFWYESSLGNFICTGDFMVVDVAQSRITPDKAGRDFYATEVIAAAIGIINEQGGLKTVFGHDSLSDYDYFTTGSAGLPKTLKSNGQIDFIQIVFRNTGRIIENGKHVNTYGQLNPGEGYFMQSSLNPGILIGNKICRNDMYSYQNLGVNDLINPTKSIHVHEFAHSFLGPNAFHTSGGNHFGTYNSGPFIGLQGGYGIIGGYNSSLLSCNAYERWRLGWISSTYNPEKYPIAASGKASDISIKDGKQQFMLRDFVSTGDAIRIKLPYKDHGASNQYIWIENHQVGKNNRIDFLNYSANNSCRDKGSPGIYMYIQVGKDVLVSSSLADIYPGNETDNLKMFSAKGNYDRSLVSLSDTLNCVAWKAVVKTEAYDLPNPLTGYNDLMQHLFDHTDTARKLNDEAYTSFPSIVYRKGIKYDNLPYLGDNLDAFSGNKTLSINSNPVPCNAVTFYNNPGGGRFKPESSAKNNPHIFITGLYIELKEQDNGSFHVTIGWDQRTLYNNVRWAGNIILSDSLFIGSNSRLLLDQGYTPVQTTKDSVSGFFAPPTVMKTGEKAPLILFKKAMLTLDHGSTLSVSPNSSLVMNRNSRIVIRKNCSLIIEKGASFVNNGGKIIVREGGKFEDKNLKTSL